MPLPLSHGCFSHFRETAPAITVSSSLPSIPRVSSTVNTQGLIMAGLPQASQPFLWHLQYLVEINLQKLVTLFLKLKREELVTTAQYTQATVRGEKPVLMCEKEGRVLADKAGQDRGQ